MYSLNISSYFISISHTKDFTAAPIPNRKKSDDPAPSPLDSTFLT